MHTFYPNVKKQSQMIYQDMIYKNPGEVKIYLDTKHKFCTNMSSNICIVSSMTSRSSNL